MVAFSRGPFGRKDSIPTMKKGTVVISSAAKRWESIAQRKPPDHFQTLSRPSQLPPSEQLLGLWQRFALHFRTVMK